MKILLIDNNKEITSLFHEYFENKGHQCVIINEGNNGLAALEKNDYDVIIMELELPEFSGYDVINELEKTGRIKEQNIVILTNMNGMTEEEIKKLKQQGIKTILRKPIEPNLLLTEMIVHSNKTLSTNNLIVK